MYNSVIDFFIVSFFYQTNSNKIGGNITNTKVKTAVIKTSTKVILPDKIFKGLF